MKIVKASHANATSWNEYVNTHPDSTAYHNWGWLSSVEKAYGFDVTGWIAVDDDEKIIGLIPAAKIKVPLLCAKLSALPYCDAGGVLANDETIAQGLVDEALEFAKSNKVSVFEHRATSALLAEEELANASKVRMLLTLPETSEELLASFKSKLRSQIKKAEKNGLTSATGRDSGFVDGFYEVYARNMRDLGSPAHSKKWFEAIMEFYGDDAIIANVYKDDKVVGAGIVLFNGEGCSIPWASTNADYNRLAPNMLLYWTLLAFATDRGQKLFDFGRSTPGEGTYKFKAQWGAKPAGLKWQTYIDGQLKAEAPAKEGSGAREKIENIWRKLPVPVATAAGSILRKYISL